MTHNSESLNSVCNASKSDTRSFRSTITLSPRSKKRPNNRRGVVLYYTTVVMVLLCGFCSFAVDFGRVQVAKTELRRAADSASRAAAAELPDVNSAVSFAISYSAKNTADGNPIVLNA